MRGPALMAQEHKLQDTPSTPSAKAANEDRSVVDLQPTAAKAPGSFAISALGVNAWAASVGWTLLSPDLSLVHTLLASLALVPLGLGALLQARARTPSWQIGARWLLLCVFPLSLSAALCLGDEAGRERAHSAVSMVLAAISLLAYGAATLQATRVPLPLLPTKSHARRSEPRLSPKRESVARLLAAGCLILGAFAIALMCSDYTQLETAWGDAADAGATLTAVVAGSIAVTLVGLELGPLLKPKAAAQISARKRKNRIATMLFLAMFGGAVYLRLMF
jgi:hypothetical protein